MQDITEKLEILATHRVLDELSAPGKFLAGLKVVAFFGSARLPMGHPWCLQTEAMAAQLSAQGISILTGGGPGIMEAANRGATTGTGRSCGLYIRLPFEESRNSFVHEPFSYDFHHFFSRKLAFVQHAAAFVVFPGGFGTLDELFDCLTLIQTQRLPRVPIFLIGVSFWAGLVDWLRGEMLGHGLISPEDLDLMQVTDDCADVAHRLGALLQERASA